MKPQGTDYPALFSRNQRLIDNQFPVPTAEEVARNPKLAGLQERNGSANGIAKTANQQMLSRILQ